MDTANDFGKNGSLPTHPELLDWLAMEFRDGGHSFKKLHKLIMLSSVYRQASAHDKANAKKDADNFYLWKMNRKKLDAEGIRDSVLAVSGQMNYAMGSPGFDLFRFKDDHSPIQRVEFSQDGQRWRGVFPVDGIADSRAEHYELAIDGELGERGVTLRANDSMNNVATTHVDAPRR